MKTFFTTITLAVSSLSFYATLLFTPLKRSLRFYFIFLLLVAVVRSLPLVIFTIPQISRDITQTITEFTAQYPEDLVVTWTGSELQSTTSSLPIYFSTPLKNRLAETVQAEYFGYLDATMSAQPRNNALFAITDKTVTMHAGGETSESVPLVSFLGTQPIQVSKTTATTLQTEWQKNSNFYTLLSFVFTPIFIFITLLVQRSLMLVIEAALFYFFKKIQGVNWTYSTSLTYAIHIFVPAEIISFVAQYTYPSAEVSFFSLTVWIYFILLLFMPPVIKIIRKN